MGLEGLEAAGARSQSGTTDGFQWVGWIWMGLAGLGLILKSITIIPPYI